MLVLHSTGLSCLSRIERGMSFVLKQKKTKTKTETAAQGDGLTKKTVICESPKVKNRCFGKSVVKIFAVQSPQGDPPPPQIPRPNEEPITNSIINHFMSEKHDEPVGTRELYCSSGADIRIAGFFSSSESRLSIYCMQTSRSRAVSFRPDIQF